MGLLSREVVRRVAPFVAAGAAGAAGAVLAQRRLMRARRLALTPGGQGFEAAPPAAPAPAAARTPPSPAPDPSPPTPVPSPQPVPAPSPQPTPPPSPQPTPPPSPEPVPAPSPQPIPPPSPQPIPPPSPEPVPPPELGTRVEDRVRDALAETGYGDAVDVSAEGSQVVLRGRVDSPEQIDALRRAATAVPGVEGVRVLLHLPGRVRRG